MAVAAHDRHAGLGQSALGGDDVHDSLAVGSEPVQRDPEFGAVRAQCPQRAQAHRLAHGQRVGRDVVVLGGQRQIGSADRAAGQAQSVEGLRAGDLVHEMQVDVEQVGLGPAGPDEMVVPELLGQGAAHHAYTASATSWADNSSPANDRTIRPSRTT